MTYATAFFIVLLSTALALGGAMAHALELPNKIGLPRDEYFVVQQAYNGWNQLAYLLLVERGYEASGIFARRRRRVSGPGDVRSDYRRAHPRTRVLTVLARPQLAAQSPIS